MSQISYQSSGGGGSGDVTAGANLTDNAIVRGDGGAKGVQTTSVLIDDSDYISGAASIRLEDGSTSIPSLAFASDTDTGIYYPGFAGFGFVLGGSGIFNINSSSIISLTNFGFLIQIGTGSAGQPTYGFKSDTGLGMYRISADTLGLAAGSALRMQLDSDGVTLESGASINEFSTDGTLAGNSDDAVPTEKAVKTYVDAAAGGMPPLEIGFDAYDVQITETNFAALELLEGTTVNTHVRAFNDTTEQYVNGKLQVPGDIDTSGTVTFRAYVMAKTAAASKNIALTFGHIPLNDSEDFDVAYTDEDSGDIAIDATQDNVTEATWTESVTNLGWAANDMVIWRLSRDPAATNDLTGDMYLFHFSVEIPRS